MYLVKVAKAGFSAVSVDKVEVAVTRTTTQNFSLTDAPDSACLTDTTQADFLTGVSTNLDLNTSPGDVTLSNAPAIDQQNTTLGSFGVGINTTTWGGQTFTPAVTGQLTRADINLFCSGCTGTTPNLTLSLSATSGGLPTGADIASATITGFNSGSAAFYTANFASPATLTASTQYALVIRPTANPSAGTYALTRSGAQTTGADVYAGGTRVSGATSGTVWSIPLTGGVSTDAGFKAYMQTGFAASGNLISSTKDANPSPGFTPIWSTFSWNGTTPANTSLKFQIAASNNVNGPFSFVGPDGTAATFFTTSPVNLQPPAHLLRRPSQLRAEQTTRRAQHRSLARDDLEIRLLIQLQVVPILNLQQFPLAHLVGRPRDQPAGELAVQARAQVIRMADQIIPQQHRRFVLVPRHQMPVLVRRDHDRRVPHHLRHPGRVCRAAQAG